MADTVELEALAVGRAVLAAIAAAGLTHAAAAKGAGITPTTFGRRVRGVVPFTFPELVRIAELCDVRVSDIAASAERIALSEARKAAAST